MKSISANLNVMIRAGEKASKTLIRDFGELEQLQVSVKGNNDFVTNADLKVEKIIIDELSKSRKNYSILSEENGSIIKEDLENVWIIDPIDGTINFLHGIPHFAISIALRSNDEIIAGLIYDPIKDEMFYAEKNNGAYLNNKRIRVSKRNKIENCLFACGETDKENLKKNTNLKFSLRRTGSAALDMAYVAAGRYDGYFQKNLNLWDIAAGAIIVQEAGGNVNNLDIKKNNNINIIASSSSINEKLLQNLINF